MTEEVRKYKTDPDKIFVMLKESSKDAGFNIDKIDETNRRLILSTGMSLLSYGENVEVIVNPEREGGSKVYVKSWPRVWFNVTADGNVKRNIQKIFDSLEKDLINR